MLRRWLATLAALLFALVVVLSCGENGTEPLPCGDGTPPPCADGQITVPISLSISQFTNVGLVVVEITGPDIDPPIVVNLTIDNGTASGMLTIPTGSDRTITVRVYDTGGIETHRGSVTIDVVEGSTPSVTLTLLPITDDVPIDVRIGAITIDVSPSADTLAIGDTVRLSAAVTDTSGTALGVSVSWASTNPARAMVDTAGLVTAVGSGDVQVVATYAGVAGQAHLHVTGGNPYLDEAEFLTASGATLTVSYPNIKAGDVIPYTENGVHMAQAAGAKNGVQPYTPVLDGYEFGVSGVENIDITFDTPVTAFGFWMQDGFVVGDISAPGTDSQFDFIFKSGNTIVAQFSEDPPIDQAFFFGVVLSLPFDKVEIRETVGTDENDFFGHIYLK